MFIKEDNFLLKNEIWNNSEVTNTSYNKNQNDLLRYIVINNNDRMS